MDRTTDSIEYNELMIDYLLASSVARHFGLRAEYFSQAYRTGGATLHDEIVLQKQCDMLFIKLPKKAMEMLRDGAIVVKLDCDDDEKEFDYILQLTRQTRIGFWK